MTAGLTTESIFDITREAWAALVAADDCAVATGQGSAPDDGFTAAVGISGAWNGVVDLTCSQRAARRAAAVMFGLDDADLGPAEVQDAVGELANVVGGNVKALLPVPTDLSLPVVGTVSQPADRPEGARLVGAAHLQWGSEAVVVRVWST